MNVCQKDENEIKPEWSIKSISSFFQIVNTDTPEAVQCLLFKPNMWKAALTALKEISRKRSCSFPGYF